LRTSVPDKPAMLKLSMLLCAWLGLLCLTENSYAQTDTLQQKNDTTSLPYKPTRKPSFRSSDRYGDPFSNSTSRSPLFLKDPNQMKLDMEIDTALNYTIYERIGDFNYRPVSSMSFQEFKQYQDRQMLKEYWQGRSRAMDGESAISERGGNPKIYISPVLDRIFGGSYMELIPRGFVTIGMGADFQRIFRPDLPIRQQRSGGFEFDDMAINMNVIGKIGDKLQIAANFDNNNSFDFQNNMKIEYTGYKEDILQKLEIGNVSLPLNNTLIQGAQNLFGVKAQMQFGKLNVTTIASTQQGKTSSLDIGGGAGTGGGQGRPFEIIGSNYDDNRHFFLGHFFRENYSRWIGNLPQITSGINITRVEVYVLNRNNDTQTLRNAVGFMDLAEPTRIYSSSVVSGRPANSPNYNGANNLFDALLPLNRNDSIDSQLQGFNFVAGTDYEKMTRARKLAPTEYTFHPQLGYITLTRKLQNDEALAVAYEYTYNGRAYKVGELSEDYASLPDEASIFLKLLRPRKVAIRDQAKRIIPTWDLMMKNIYTLNVNQLTQDGFQLRIIYKDARTGVSNPQLQDGSAQLRERQLIEILGLDKLNPVNDPGRDGNFDFVEGITINTSMGLIIFPILEPLGQGLRDAFKNEGENESYLIQKYAYDTLYRTTKADAELFATKNKFWITGTYNAGSSKEILIPGFGVSQGSVSVFAGGIPLTEGVDYVIDYTFGKITMLNESILSSGKNIEIKYEETEPFMAQSKSLVGTRFDYKLSDDINLGSTFLYYNERPMISRNQIGTEPARNMQYGFDFNINKKSRLITKIIDAIPILQTKEQSSFNLTGEFAQLLPGTSNIIDGEGTAYIDDFESAATPFSLMNVVNWKLAATPKTENFKYEGIGHQTEPLAIGYRRAKLAWYRIDNDIYFNNSRSRPSNVTTTDLENHWVRSVGPQEIFSQKQLQAGVLNEPVFDIAYYPFERGPYNYNPDLTNEGFLKDPVNNWAGITTAIRSEVDFDKSNIEYIEFWMLDPFMNNPRSKILDGVRNDYNTTGGKIIFQLGSISEDVTRDGQHGFESGLPPSGIKNDGSVKETPWGYVTTKQFVTNAFDNNNQARTNQDVGYDGLNNEEELAFFYDKFISKLTAGLTSAARNEILNDPSGDNFRFYLDNYYDERGAKMLERFKSYNGLDGNSPVVSASDLIPRSGSTLPDNEDLNGDNTLNDLEEYYEYDIDLKPGMLDIGKEYVVDKVVTTNNGNLKDPVTWYQFRIPIREFERHYGNIEGFKSIRYMRMVLTGFSQPIVLRMTNFKMVGSRWRRYPKAIREGGFIPTPEESVDDFSVSVIGLEENSAGSENKTPYVMPPGIIRDRDNTSTLNRQLNEQSIQVCVDELKDGEARAIYKNLSADLFNYGRIKMFLHAHGSNVPDSSVTAFLRIGQDLDSNYYEIEVPLVMTNPINTSIASLVWPDENQIDIDLDQLYRLKADRDREGASMNMLYPTTGPRKVGKHRIRIFGRPNLTSVQAMMIGVRNPRTIDKQAYSLCVWANELRVTDFNRTPGWAVSSTMNLKLADFATINGVLRHSTFGFGSVSSKIFERTREESTSYAVSANVNVDKLLPGNTGIKIPMYVSYEKTLLTPLYDPANPDLKLDVAMQSMNDDKRSQYMDIVRDQTIGRSLNFVNVRKVKVKPDAKTHLWDIENFSFSYSYSDRNRSNFTTQEALQIQHKGSIAYNYSPKASGIEPFKNIKGFNSPWFKLIKDFNLSLLPSSIGVRLDADRSFSKTLYRNAAYLNGDDPSLPNYMKYFTFNRQYNLRWSLTKNLSLEYTSRANAIIDEPEGEIDTREKRDSVMTNLKNFGRMKNFDQTITAMYTIPFDKLPMTDWIGADYRHSVTYNWRAGALNFPDALGRRDDIPDEYDFRNTIQNARDQNFTGKLDMVKLYNKISFLKAINTPKKTAPTRPATPQNSRVPQKPVAKADTVKAPSEPTGLARTFFRTIMSVRSINGSYTLTEGTLLPGFAPSPKFMGLDKNWGAPGWGFVMGSQDPNIRYKAGEKNWLTQNSNLTTPFTQNRNVNINVRANVEPSSDFKVQFDVKKETSSVFQSIYRYDTIPGESSRYAYQDLNPNRSGSYRISIISLKTAFNSTNSAIESDVFKTFEENLQVIQNRFQSINGLEYDTAQDVLIPAFIAAYTGKNVNTIKLTPFPRTPVPNWRIDYNGLSKLAAFKNIFQSITITHAYQSSYQVMNYSNSLEFNDATDGENLSLKRSISDYNRTYFGKNVDGRIVPVYIISQVMLSEQFNPLIGVNVRTKGKLSLNLQYKTKRDLALNISNAQITELNSKDVAIEVGYTKNNLRLPFLVEGQRVVLKNDVTFRMNMTIGETQTIQRKIGELNVLTNGNLNFQLRPNINYVVNQKLNVQLYFERNINEPLISSSYRRATTRFGVQIRFSLAQ
jgi:cell surface protein SprA